MNCPIFVLAIAMCFASPVSAQTSQPAFEDPLIRARSPLLEHVTASMSRGTRYLLAHQNADGSWDEKGQYQVGLTALTTLALLDSGESPTSPPLAKAIDWLRKNKSQKTYCVALHAAVFASLPEGMRGADVRQDLNWLLSAMETKRDDPNEGMYSYGSGPTRGGEGDFSNTQYGVLGVWYAQLSGLEVPNAYWKRVEECWRRAQSPDGGWGYTQRSQGSPYTSMTAAGAATLFITNDYLHAADAQDLNRPPHNAPLDLATRWLADHFAVDSNVGLDSDLGGGRIAHPRGAIGPPLQPGVGPPPPGSLRGARWGNYMMFAFERVGEASGLTRFGEHKWFDEGATYLLSRQRYDGSFEGDMGGVDGGSLDVVDTDYALLFLSRGRSPVLMQKLQFGTRWNNRPLDVSNFVHFMRRATERHWNWQVVGIDQPIEDWRESPMLYIASDRAIEVTAEQRDRLAEYVAEGGLLIFVNEGGGAAYTRSATALCKAIWPSYAFADVPPEHPMRRGNFPTGSWTLPIQHLSNGIRELAVFFPSGDASWKWQSNGGAISTKISPFAPLANLSLYVSGKFVPSYKGETTWIARDETAQAPANELFVARLKHAGNWNPEPLAWQRLANVLHNAADAELKTVEVEANGNELKKSFLLLDITSAGAFSMKPAEEAAIKAHLEQGGMIFFDAAGSSREAAASFEALMTRLAPDAKAAALPANHSIYLGDFPGGHKLQNFRYRYGAASDLPQTTLPRLRGYTLKQRLIAIESAEDLSAALVGYTTADVTGYAPSTAVALMRNVVLWAAQRKP